MGRLRRMPFVTKLILLVGVILTLALGTYSFQQIRKSIRIMEKDTMDNLSLLTEQVLANYRQNRDNLERQIYAAATTLTSSRLSGYSSKSRRSRAGRLIIDLLLPTIMTYCFTGPVRNRPKLPCSTWLP